MKQFSELKKKQNKKRFVGVCSKFDKIYAYMLVIVEYGLITENEIECARKVMRRSLGKAKKVKRHVNVFIQLTCKPAEVRMGRGKGGKFREKVSFVKPGQVMFEIKGKKIERKGITEAMMKVSKKLSVKVKIFNKLMQRKKQGFQFNWKNT